jgi:hypothetical protein
VESEWQRENAEPQGWLNLPALADGQTISGWLVAGFCGCLK